MSARGTLAFLVLVAAIFASARATAGATASAETHVGSVGAGERAYVLLRENRVLAIDPRTARVVRSRTLARRPGHNVLPGRRLALSADGRSLFVLVAGSPDAVAVLDPRTLRERERVLLEPGVRYRAIVPTPHRDALYVFGNRPGRVVDEVGTTPLREEAAVVTSLDMSSGTRSTITVREAEGRSWFVHWATITSDGARLVVTYHGGCTNTPRCTSGADWLDVTTAGLERCEGQAHPALGCSGQVHGMVEPYGDGFVAARGLPALGVVDRDLRLLRLVSTRLRTHLMDFALAGSTLYALGDCTKDAGLRVVSLKPGGSSRRLGPPSLCGERIALTKTTVAMTSMGRDSSGSLWFVDRRTGRLVGELTFGSDPVDIVAG